MKKMKRALYACLCGILLWKSIFCLSYFCIEFWMSTPLLQATAPALGCCCGCSPSKVRLVCLETTSNTSTMASLNIYIKRLFSGNFLQCLANL